MQVMSALIEHGLLLQQDKTLPSVTTIMHTEAGRHELELRT